MIMPTFDDYCTKKMEAHAYRFSLSDIIIAYCSEENVDTLVRRTRGRTKPSCYREYTVENLDNSTSLENVHNRIAKKQRKCIRADGKLLCFLNCHGLINSDLIDIDKTISLLSIKMATYMVIVPADDTAVDVESFVYLVEKASERLGKSIEYVRFGDKPESSLDKDEAIADTDDNRVAIAIPDGVPNSIERVDIARALRSLSISHTSLLDNMLTLGEPTKVICKDTEIAGIILRSLIRRNVKAYITED